MELHTKETSMFHHRRERAAVIARRRDGIAHRGRGIGMCEIKVRVLRNVTKKPARSNVANLVPANVWRLRARGQRAHFSCKESEPLVAGRLFTRREHSLQAEADSENRKVGIESRAQRTRKPAFLERRYKCRKVPNAWKNDRTRRGKLLRGCHALAFRSQRLKRTLDGRQVPGAIIDDRQFHRSPFVDGKTRRSCLSRLTANRSAFANALNIASTWWCDERPYRSCK